MTIKIRQTKSGVTVRATGSDADRMFAAFANALRSGRLTVTAAQALEAAPQARKPIPNHSKDGGAAHGITARPRGLVALPVRTGLEG